MTEIRCGGCGKKLALKLEGRLEIYCPRCKRYNILDSNKEYQSHRLVALERNK
ncbi:MAG: Com family DNA-binding transcriptional regulator [Dehalococcoidia bacterium]|nr:MAG: Com family DNA-binding transcriptional regulator [Dehalococcoidia bacterium]